MLKKFSTLGGCAIPCALALFFSANAAKADTIGMNLGPALGYAILGVDGGSSPAINLSNVYVHGDVGLGPNVTLQNMAPSTVGGNIYQTTAGSVTKTDGHVTGSIITQNLTAAANAALTASTNFANPSLFPVSSTLTGDITNDTTINRVGTLTVVNINGNINLNNHNLTINGNAGDNVIVNISGGLDLTGTASIVLSGGLVAQNVVLNFYGGTGGQPDFNTHVDDVVTGIVLAPHRNGTLDGIWHGELIFGYNSLGLLSGANVYGETTPPVPGEGLPLPSAAMGGAGLFGLLAARRGRRRSAV